MPHRIQITVHFLASDFAPRMSLFSGNTQAVHRAPYTLFPRVPWPWQRDVQFHVPVKIHRLPQCHLEVASRRLATVLRTALSILLGCAGLGCAIATVYRFANDDDPSYAIAFLVAMALHWSCALALVAWAPTLYVRLHMLDREEYIEVLFPDRMGDVAEAYQQAYTRWIAAGCPRHFGDPDEDGWTDAPDGPGGQWDQAASR